MNAVSFLFIFGITLEVGLNTCLDDESLVGNFYKSSRKINAINLFCYDMHPSEITLGVTLTEMFSWFQLFSSLANIPTEN
jgi:hypothetical protein